MDLRQNVDEREKKMKEQRKECTFTCEGKEWRYPMGMPILQMVREICPEKEIVLARAGGSLYELTHLLSEEMDGQEIHLIGVTDKDGKRAYRRSLVFLMQKALDLLYPDCWLDVSVHHSLGQGYYCSIVSAEGDHGDGEAEKLPEIKALLPALKREMLRLVQADIPFEKRTVHTREAEKMFREQHMVNKEKLLHYRISSHMNMYSLDGCMDYYYGYMVPSTGYLQTFDLIPFADGFMLMFPDKDPFVPAAFQPSMKLYRVLQASERWGEEMGIPSVGALNDVIAKGKVRELILMQEAFMEQRIGRLAEKIASDQSRKFVMIAGPSSSGKTTFSYRLSAQLRAFGLHPKPIALDDYYLDRDVIPLDEYGTKDLESITALDTELFNRDMLSLLEGKTVELPIFNFMTGKREYRGKTMNLGEKDVLVIEGIHGLNDLMSRAIPPQYKFKIYISALTQLCIDERNPLSTTDGRLIRRIVRDARTRGTAAKDTIAMWDSVRRGEEKNIFPFQEQADEMFNSALIYEMAVLKLYAQPQLLAIERDCPEYVEAKRLLKLLDYFLPMSSEDIGNNSILREFIGGSCLPV